MSSSFKKTFTKSFKVKKRSLISLIPRIKRRKGNNDDLKKNEPTILAIEQEEASTSVNEEKQELYSLRAPISIFNLPTEIYLHIFSYLLFTDLYTLSCVSKFFRDLLWSKEEFTQTIWKNCRLLHYPNYPKLPPPDGMCEQQYIWITLAKKTCQFCNETYEKSSYDKWFVKINCCNLCMTTDEYVIEENSVNKSITFPRELKDCIPYTQYIAYLDHDCNNNCHSLNHNFHKYYFIQDVEKIKNEYDSLAEEGKQGWIENKRRELRSHLEKIKDYQKQDSGYYWFNIAKNLNLIPLEIENGDSEAVEEEEDDDYYDEEDDYYV